MPDHLHPSTLHVKIPRRRLDSNYFQKDHSSIRSSPLNRNFTLETRIPVHILPLFLAQPARHTHTHTHTHIHAHTRYREIHVTHACNVHVGQFQSRETWRDRNRSGPEFGFDLYAHGYRIDIQLTTILARTITTSDGRACKNNQAANTFYLVD